MELSSHVGGRRSHECPHGPGPLLAILVGELVGHLKDRHNAEAGVQPPPPPNVLSMTGLEMIPEESALGDYLRQFRPTIQQLTPMLNRLKSYACWRSL